MGWLTYYLALTHTQIDAELLRRSEGAGVKTTADDILAAYSMYVLLVLVILLVKASRLTALSPRRAANPLPRNLPT